MRDGVTYLYMAMSWILIAVNVAIVYILLKKRSFLLGSAFAVLLASKLLYEIVWLAVRADLFVSLWFLRYGLPLAGLAIGLAGYVVALSYAIRARESDSVLPDLSFTCPLCGQHLSASADMRGMTLSCPSCSKKLQIPGGAPPPLHEPVRQTQCHTGYKERPMHQPLVRKAEQVVRGANPRQRIVIATVFPIVTILLGYGLMTIINSHSGYRDWGWDFHPDNFAESWWGWILVFITIGVVEWIIFASRERMSTIDGKDSSHVFAEDEATGQPSYKGSYIKNPDGKGGTAIFGKDATPLTVIQMFLMHIADMAPESTKRAFCDWANVSATQWTGQHRDLFANAFLHYLQELRQEGRALPTEYEALMPDLMKQTLPAIPRPLTPQLRNEIRAILFGH